MRPDGLRSAHAGALRSCGYYNNSYDKNCYNCYNKVAGMRTRTKL
ncbi:hypothetical protein GMORB2_4503 [Geosmithia morbida]|uniref:Uncharacterized protein n=1 Tax=Geosmithia morbida TaxID=1094350 RepID=A0A9P4YRB1_9HYPO|nr:uncharacterized protein GMORB2_4503 [Geosmithia morbida]KAF4119594.1 hypothetical protein GMORB2_4503 [Geosmithia morbida]